MECSAKRGVDGEDRKTPASQLSRRFARRCKLGASPVSGLRVVVCATFFAGLGGIQSAYAMSGNKTIRVSNSLHLLERFCFRDGESPILCGDGASLLGGCLGLSDTL